MLFSAVLLLALLLVSLLFYQPASVIVLLERMIPGVLWQVTTTQPMVALTFDDGPDRVYTPEVLDILRNHGAKATFFLTGLNAGREPELVTRILSEGHQIGNHLLADEYVILKDENEIERSLMETESVLPSAQGSKYVRPPRIIFGPAFSRVASRHGYQIVLGSGYASDPYRPPARYISWAMTRMLRPGAILVLHDSGGDRRKTVEALPPILISGRARGLRFVTLDTLVAAGSR